MISTDWPAFNTLRRFLATAPGSDAFFCHSAVFAGTQEFDMNDRRDEARARHESGGSSSGGLVPAPGAVVGRMSGIQRLLVVVSVLVMAGGIALGFTQGSPEQSRATTMATGDGGTNANGTSLDGMNINALDGSSGFGLPGGVDNDTAGSGGDPLADANALERDDWSPAVFRMGFSFFVGFAVAFALRSFIRFSLVTFGFFFLMLFGLQYAGFIDVNWTAIGDKYDSTRDFLGEQFASIKSFMTGMLPSGVAASAGLLTGFRRG